jgi:hypothetical protein
MAMIDTDIPDFLRLSAEERKKIWDKFQPKNITAEVIPYDSRKPSSVSPEEWERMKAERKRRVEVVVVRKAKAPPVDTKGKRWDAKKGKWINDPFPFLPVHVPARPVKAPPKPRRAVPAGSFGITEGTNRDKLAKAMAKRLGELVPLVEWSLVVYGKENASACGRVIDGLIYDLKKNKLPFEVIKDKNEKGQIVFGLFETE